MWMAIAGVSWKLWVADSRECRKATMNADATDGPRQQPSPFNWLSLGPAVIPAAGVLLYGALNIAYSLFYGRLGVSPEDVGLGYASTLSRSTGFVLVVVLGFVFGVSPILWQRSLRRQRMLAKEEAYRYVPGLGDREYEEMRRQELDMMRRQQQAWFDQLHNRRVAMVVIATITVFLIVPTMVAPVFSAGRANDVRAGIATTPVSVLGLTILDVHANPATIRATGKRGETAAIDELQSEKLLYLGQSNGISVFFSSSAKHAVYIPSSSIVLRIETQ